LKKISFSIFFSYGLLGASGCGKTTILSCLVNIQLFKFIIISLAIEICKLVKLAAVKITTVICATEIYAIVISLSTTVIFVTGWPEKPGPYKWGSTLRFRRKTRRPQNWNSRKTGRVHATGKTFVIKHFL
jgi:hypothetical protein